MTEYIDANIQNAMMTQLTSPPLTDSNSNAYPMAFPFLPYDPIEDTPYMEAWPIMKAKTQHPTLGYYDSDLQRGIFQVDAVVPDGRGEPIGLRMQAQIVERFAMGTVLLAGQRNLYLNAPPQVTQGMKDGAWIRFPVSITFTLIGGPLS